MDNKLDGFLPLAARIAREFSDIPGLPLAEIELTAQEALARAARFFDPAKGDFAAYAATAMRNALRDLRDRQIRHHRHHVYNLDATTESSATTPGPRVEQIPAGNAPVFDEAAALESSERLNRALAVLTPRLRQVAEGIRDGRSYSEIGASLGVSKQAAHKLAHAAIATLREKLAAMGFSGLDTLGFLKSGCGVPPQSALEASRFQPSPPEVDDFPPHP
jgi:RNA polymerase sigma factor (sigma-70 family)